MGEVEADRCSRLFAEGLERVLERRDLLLAPGRALGEVHARVEAGPKLEGSIGEGSNHSNFSHRSSVRILSKFSTFR